MPTVEVVQATPSTFENIGKVQTDVLSISKPETGKFFKYGLEVTEHILWQGWKPGREYTKNIVLKNVQIKTQKIRYKVPSLRFFSTIYPKPIVLSAGMSYVLPVTFRPLENILYEDVLQFRSKDGDFEVPIRAILPQTTIQSPATLDFCMCAVKDFVPLTFDVLNTGDVETHIRWEIAEPFTIEPLEADLPVKASCKFKAVFKPEFATVYEAFAVCKYGEGQLSHLIKFIGIGKFPHILVSSCGKPSSNLRQENLEAIVHFGKAPVGSVTTKWIELYNLSPVRAPYRVQHPTELSRIDTVFYCPETIGIAPPMSAVRIPLVYKPNTIDTTSVDYFHVSAVGKVSQSIIKCVGISKGPIVKLSTNALNFMSVNTGETGSLTFDIINNSDMEAVYQFMIDSEESVFKFQYVSGVLKANSKQNIGIKFNPTYPICYYRRIMCLIHNQSPLYLDLLGTCHSETLKPAILMKPHIKRYIVNAQRGFSLYAPEQLNELLKNGKLECDDNGYIQVPQHGPVEISTPVKSEPSIPDITLADEYFNDGFHSDEVSFVPHVSADTNLADFGSCQNLRAIENKTVSVTNHTKGKVNVQWITEANRTFSVFPAEMEIPPLKTCSFRITFKPEAPNKLYGSELECYASYKSLRDYRLVEDPTHFPPWCLTLTCTGQTFMSNNETYLPRYNLDSPQLTFPAVNTKETTYRTMCMTNTGTTPILYDMEKDPNNIFGIKPAKGLLKGGVQIFQVRCKPVAVKIYRHDMVMKLNDNNKYSKTLQFSGSAESAEIMMESDGVMYFKPTCVGTASRRNFSIKNVSRIPLRFEWKLVSTETKLLRVSPDCGIIQPNESQSQSWLFTPHEEQKFVLKPKLIVWGQGQRKSSSGGKKNMFQLRIIGEGATGSLVASEQYFDFGDIVVGNVASHQITLFNNSRCSLHFSLLVTQLVEGPYADECMSTDRIGLDLETKDGVLPSRSRHTVRLAVCPQRRVTYQYTIQYKLHAPEKNVLEGTTGHVMSVEPQHLCHILVTGVYPLMAITDARCYGSASGVSKKQLWSLFSIDNLNACLDLDPSAEEIMHNNLITKRSVRRCPSIYTRAIMDFNFSAAPLNSEPCFVNLMFENTGTVPTHWAFLFPCDLQMELEYWAETGDYDEDELHEMKVMDNKLFSIEPKRGKLSPGETQTVTFTYKHTMAGTDHLPVLLKLSKGREILLNFLGVTVDPERRYIHFPSNKHLFTPVPVGEKNSPKQMYEVYNGGALPVKYQFDLTPLELLRQENFDQPIFECLNPIGEIPPGSSVMLEWRFSPLEAKTYMIDVPVYIQKGDTAVLTFTGVGYDPRVMGDTMPLTDQADLSGVPSVQSVDVPGQLAYLSRERISFNNMPLFSRSRHMVVVINKSQERSVSFEWHVTTSADSKYLSICPIRGVLEAGEAKMCRVTFLALGVPSFYDLDLVCEITDIHEVKTYRKKLSEWETERERQKHEFTITEDNINTDENMPTSPEIHLHLDSIHEDSRYTPSPDACSELTRYKTLPPINQKSCDQENEDKKKKKRNIKNYWEKPVPDRPFLLHLGLTARSHDIRDYQIHFPEDYRKYYIDRSHSLRAAKPAVDSTEDETGPPTSLSCTQSEAGLLVRVVTSIIRSLLDDATFHESVRKVCQEPIPYFNQFTPRKHRSVPPTPTTTPIGSELSITSDRTASDEVPDEPRNTVSQPANEELEVARLSPESVTSINDSLASSPSRKVLSSTPSDRLSKADNELEHLLKQKNSIKKTSEFGNALESILENSVMNILTEAFSTDFSITARPRFIALPKRPPTFNSRFERL